MSTQPIYATSAAYARLDINSNNPTGNKVFTYEPGFASVRCAAELIGPTAYLQFTLQDSTVDIHHDLGQQSKLDQVHGDYTVTVTPSVNLDIFILNIEPREILQANLDRLINRTVYGFFVRHAHGFDSMGNSIIEVSIQTMILGRTLFANRENSTRLVRQLTPVG